MPETAEHMAGAPLASEKRSQLPDSSGQGGHHPGPLQSRMSWGSAAEGRCSPPPGRT